MSSESMLLCGHDDSFCFVHHEMLPTLVRLHLLLILEVSIEFMLIVQPCRLGVPLGVDAYTPDISGCAWCTSHDSPSSRVSVDVRTFGDFRVAVAVST